jgi:hypothetical protein
MATLGDMVAMGQPMGPATQGNPISSANEGIQQGVKLAQEKQNVEKGAQDLQIQKEALDTAKFNKGVSSMQTLARMRPEIAKRAVPKVLENLRAAGIPVDQSVLDAMASDDSYKVRFLSIASALSGEASNPETRAAAMQAFSDIGEFDKGLSAFETTSKLKQAKDLAEARLEESRRSHDAANNSRSERISNQAQGLHNRNVKQFQADSAKELTQYNNLTNAVSNFKNGTPTTQSFHELQQSVRSNLGIKGGSGVDERSAAYLDGLGLKVADVAQFLSMTPQDIRKFKGAPFADHILGLAENERNNIRQQIEQKAGAAKAANGTFYDRYPELGDDFTKFLGAKTEAFNRPSGGEPAANAGLPPPPAGKLKSAIELLQNAKLPPEVIKQKLTSRGYKEADIDAVLKGK